MYTAGRIIEEVSGMRNSVEGNYLKMKSYLDNLNVWLDEEHEKSGQGLYSYRAPLESIISKEVLDRYARLNLAPYKGFINPVYRVEKDANGEITDVKLDYTEAYDHQMLRYSNDYATLPYVNE